MYLNRRNLLKGALGAAALGITSPLELLAIDPEANGWPGNPNPNPNPNPAPGPGPGPQPPTGSGVIDLAPFLIMNMQQRPGKNPGFLGTFNTPIHMEGYSTCPSGPDPNWCASGAGGLMWHQYVLMKDVRPIGTPAESEIVFIKSPGSGGMERHQIRGDRVVIYQEKLDWDYRAESKYRDFEDENGRLGALWAWRHIPAGQIFETLGTQRHYRCDRQGGQLAQYGLDSIAAMLGPYAIDTVQGFNDATRDLARYVPNGAPIIPPQWPGIASSIPGMDRDAHVWLVVRPDAWSRGRHDSTLSFDDYNMQEIYWYLMVGSEPTINGYLHGGRGLGMTRWTAYDNMAGRFVKEGILDRVVVDPFLIYDGRDACAIPAPATGNSTGNSGKKRRGRKQRGGGKAPGRGRKGGAGPRPLRGRLAQVDVRARRAYAFRADTPHWVDEWDLDHFRYHVMGQ